MLLSTYLSLWILSKGHVFRMQAIWTIIISALPRNGLIEVIPEFFYKDLKLDSLQYIFYAFHKLQSNTV